MSEPLLQVDALSVHFEQPGVGRFAAVDGVSFDLAPAETLGIVGESGCGKSTLARAILQLVPASAGRVAFLGDEPRNRRRDLQVVFQDPLASLNPTMRVGEIVAEPLYTHFPRMDRTEVRRRVIEMLGRVGLSAEHAGRRPRGFSGGQCQRIGIARALVAEPKLVICDEPVSALDVSIRAQIVNLLTDLQREMGLSLLFIAHDLAVVRHISHRVMVMYQGRVAELAPRDALYSSPCHPYTRALLDAGYGVRPPKPPATVGFGGLTPSTTGGCAYRARCPRAEARCAEETPPLRPVGESTVACHFPLYP